MGSARTWIAVIAGLLVCACSKTNHPAPAAVPPFNDFNVVTAEQTACLFECPVFKVEVFSDGLVRHSGPAFERTGGPHEARTDRRGLEQIAKALRDARFDDMRDRYLESADGCAETFTDQSTLLFHVDRGRDHRKKSVTLYAGCLGPGVPSERINALINAINQVTSTDALLEQRQPARKNGAGAATPV